MQIQTDVSLKDYSTMRRGGDAAYLATIHNEAELQEAVAWARERDLPVVVVGDGSNVVWRDEGFPGLVLVNRIKGYTEEQKDGHVLLNVGAGENWDDTIARTTAKGYTGIENLSLIPGTVGATPVQNVGAYSQDISDTLVHLTAYDMNEQKMVALTKEECNLAYR